MATLENSGQVAGPNVPIAVSGSGHATFPSAAFGLIVKPSGRVTTDVRSSDGEGVWGLCSCGTLRIVSRPDGVSVAAVVELPVRLGSKLAWAQPVVAGQGVSAWTTSPPKYSTSALKVRSAAARRRALQERAFRAVRFLVCRAGEPEPGSRRTTFNTWSKRGRHAPNPLRGVANRNGVVCRRCGHAPEFGEDLRQLQQTDLGRGDRLEPVVAVGSARQFDQDRRGRPSGSRNPSAPAWSGLVSMLYRGVITSPMPGITP